MKRYKAGIVGCGQISASHFDGLKSTGRVEIACAWDTDPSALGQAVDTWTVRGCSSAEDLFASDIDLVVIATPGFAHRQYVEMAAAAGKHMLCEKPVALNLEDAAAMQDSVVRSGLIFQTGFSYRYDAELAKLKKIQDSDRIGTTVSAWARVHAPAPSERWRKIQESGHWRASMRLSGGRINEFCSHTINWLLWVLGPPRSVYGRALNVTEGFELDDTNYALIACERGTGLLEVNRHAGVAREMNFGILGRGGSVVLKEGNLRLTPMDAETVSLQPLEGPKSKHHEFLDCIDTGTQPLSNIVDAIDTLKVCLAFNRSVQSGAVEYT